MESRESGKESGKGIAVVMKIYPVRMRLRPGDELSMVRTQRRGC